MSVCTRNHEGLRGKPYLIDIMSSVWCPRNPQWGGGSVSAD